MVTVKLVCLDENKKATVIGERTVDGPFLGLDDVKAAIIALKHNELKRYLNDNFPSRPLGEPYWVVYARNGKPVWYYGVHLEAEMLTCDRFVADVLGHTSKDLHWFEGV